MEVLKDSLENATANDAIAIATTGNFSITSGSPNIFSMILMAMEVETPQLGHSRL